MKIKAMAGALVLAGLISCNASAGDKPVVLKSKMDSVSYAIGASIGTNFKTSELTDLNLDIFTAAIKHHLDDKATKLLDEAAMQQVMTSFQTEMAAKAKIKAESEGKDNLQKGIDFLAKNKTAKGVKTTESGLQYSVITMGKGAKPKATDKVKVHYHGTVLDGSVFDSSVDRGQPIEFNLNGVIKGWTEGLQLMPVGSKFKFYIPSELAYGPQRRSAKIGPNELLIFEVELIEIVK